MVALELRETDVTRAADVVFPVAAAIDKAGTFVTWEGRPRCFDAVFTNPQALPDSRVLAGIAEELARSGTGARWASAPSPRCAPRWRTSARGTATAPRTTRCSPPSPPGPPADGLALATWKQLLDNGSMQDGDDNLRATARNAVARVSQAVFDACGPTVTVTGDRGRVDAARRGRRRRPTAWSGCRPTTRATACSPTSPRPAAGSP